MSVVSSFGGDSSPSTAPTAGAHLTRSLDVMMFCPDCSADLNKVDVGAPCPRCGGKRRSSNATPQTARAFSTVHSPTIIAESNFPDGSTSIVVGSEDFASRSVTSAGGNTQTFEGLPPQHEDDVLEVCHSLRQVLHGDVWGQLDDFVVPTGLETGVDAVAVRVNGGRLVQVQVTRVAQQVWPRLADAARRGEALQVSRQPDALTEDIREAVDRKARGCAPAQRAELILALDVRRTPEYVTEQVCQSYLTLHGQWTRSLGFEAVFLVGAGPLVNRIG